MSQYTLGQIPIFNIPSNSNHILLAGAGGGFDIFGGIPLYFSLLRSGKKVTLANLTFSDFDSIKADESIGCIKKVTSESEGSTGYFPEKYLSKWLKLKTNTEVPVYTIKKLGVKPISSAYNDLAGTLAIDAVVLIDGGTDSLMRGDESGLGTPHEDVLSIMSCANLDVEHKLLACIGFGIDHYHGVSHYDYLGAVAELAKLKKFYGCFSVLNLHQEFEVYRDLLDFVSREMPGRESIVNTSILASIEGEYGDYHSTPRTKSSKLWINPLMSLYWVFDLPAVCDRILYKDYILDSLTMRDIDEGIYQYRKTLGNIRDRYRIPL